MLKALVPKFRSDQSAPLKDIAKKQVPAKLKPIVGGLFYIVGERLWSPCQGPYSDSFSKCHKGVVEDGSINRNYTKRNRSLRVAVLFSTEMASDRSESFVQCYWYGNRNWVS